MKFHVEGGPDGADTAIVGVQEDRGVGSPSDPKDSPPSTGSTSSFPVGAAAETWAILLPASCASVQVTQLPCGLAPLPSHP